MGQRSGCPAIAVTRVVGAEVRAMGVGAPARPRIAPHRDATKLVEADHRAARRRIRIEPDDGPLFSAKSRSVLSSQVRGCCRLRYSALRMRRIWLRLIGVPPLPARPGADPASSGRWAAPPPRSVWAGGSAHWRSRDGRRPRCRCTGGSSGGASSSSSSPGALNCSIHHWTHASLCCTRRAIVGAARPGAICAWVSRSIFRRSSSVNGRTCSVVSYGFLDGGDTIEA